MKNVIDYFTDRSEKSTKFHWVIITVSIFCYLVATSTTWWGLQYYPNTYSERNPLATLAFQYLGMIPTFIIVLFFIVIVMISIPYIFRQNKSIGIAANLGFLLFFMLDAGHNMYRISGYNLLFYLPYNITSTLFDLLGVARV